MDFKEVARRLGIENCPDAVGEAFASLPSARELLCRADEVRALEADYGCLGHYCEAVALAAEEIRRREDLFLWAQMMTHHIATAESAKLRAVPVPPTDGTLAADMLPLLVLLSEARLMAARYRDRGFAEEEIRRLLSRYQKCLEATELLKGRPMLDAGRYSWLLYYVKGEIFDYKAFNFQPATFFGGAYLLRHRETGELCYMMSRGRFHRSGRVLGSVGCTDEEGAFDAEFEESAAGFCGHPVRGSLVSFERVMMRHEEWECVLRQGDAIVHLHIPRGADLTPAYVEESLREGFALTKAYYPECHPRAIDCVSWLMDPTLARLLGDEARLSRFGNRFMKFPIIDYGRACHTFAFPGYEGRPLQEYPETTTLHRKLKAHLLAGDYIYTMVGVIPESLSW